MSNSATLAGIKHHELWRGKATSALVSRASLTALTEAQGIGLIAVPAARALAAVQTVTMYDAISIYTIPANAKFLAGYVDINGNYQGGYIANYVALGETFPGIPRVTITRSGLPGYHVADCENGDLTFWGAAVWASNEVKAGRRPTIYVETANRPGVVAALKELGLAFGVNVDCWRAWWDGIAEVMEGDVALQYKSLYDEYDTSIALRSWSAFPPIPVAPKEGRMVIVWNGSYWREVIRNGNSVWMEQNAGSVADIKASGYPVVNCQTAGLFNSQPNIPYSGDQGV